MDICELLGHSSDVSARSGEAGDEPGLHDVRRRRRDDGNRPCRPLGGTDHKTGPRHDDVNLQADNGRTALINASWGHEGIVRLLLEGGADVNLQANNGRTALIEASLKGHEGIVRLLLEGGADVNLEKKSGKRRTALQIASKRGHEEIVRLLQDAAVDEGKKL